MSDSDEEEQQQQRRQNAGRSRRNYNAFTSTLASLERMDIEGNNVLSNVLNNVIEKLIDHLASSKEKTINFALTFLGSASRQESSEVNGDGEAATSSVSEKSQTQRQV